MSHNKEFIQRFQSKTAYPTILLTIVSGAAYVLASLALIKGSLSPLWVILINTVCAYLLFTPMHEAGHLNIGGKRSRNWMDEIIGWISGIPLLSPFYIFRAIHFRHHAFTNHPEKDPDHWLASKNLVALIFHSTTIFPVYLINGVKLIYSEEKVSNKVKNDMKIGFVALFLMFAFMCFLGFYFGWDLVLYFWVIPAVIAQAFLALTFDWLPHHPHEETDKYQNSRIFEIPGLSVLFLGQNFHLIHHLYPRIPFYNYGKAYFSIKEELIDKKADIVTLEKKRKP